MAITLPLGSGNSGTNDWADVYNNDAQLVTEIDARDDNYQTIAASSGFLNDSAGAGTFILAPPSVVGAIDGSAASGASVYGSTGARVNPAVFYFDDADYTIASKTQKLRVRAQIAVNATAPAITYTVGLYPITVAGAADALTMTLGTVVTGSTVAFASPAASTVAQANSGDLTIPSDGAYTFGVVRSGSATADTVVFLSAQLQTRWV